MSKTIYDFNVKRIDGTNVELRQYAGKVLLLVNVASECGLTPQYEGLEKLYSEYKEKGLVVLGFPANEFGSQEPGSNAEIQEFCRTNYGVNFPMFEKIVVKGQNQHPLYHYLITNKPEAVLKPDSKLIPRLKEKGLLTGASNDIKWNFEKFLIGKNGEIVERFSPDIAPMDPIILKSVEHEIERT